jgi:hypothetical protein
MSHRCPRGLRAEMLAGWLQRHWDAVRLPRAVVATPLLAKPYSHHFGGSPPSGLVLSGKEPRHWLVVPVTFCVGARKLCSLTALSIELEISLIRKYLFMIKGMSQKTYSISANSPPCPWNQARVGVPDPSNEATAE